MAEADIEPESEAGSELTEEEAEGTFQPKVRWTIPQVLKQMSFVGKDVFAIGHDLYITFFNLKSNTESVYVANSEEKGDGVDCVAGHRSNVFAFTEKRTHARIFLVSYPKFEILNILQDTLINRYKGICMMEADLVCGFSGFHKYVMTLWSWRNGQRLLEVPTGIIRRDQIYMASRTHMLICECWGEGVVVWEVAQCYKKCLVMKRVMEEKTGWEISEPKLVGVCWSNEGQLYAIDSKANLYGIRSDGIKLTAELEWSDNLTGEHAPCVCTFGNGMLVYGPDNTLRALKKAEQCWKVSFSYKPRDTILRLVSNASCDVGIMWGSRGLVYKLAGEAEDKIDVQIVTFKQRDVKRVQLIAPDFDYVAMMDDNGCLCVYNIKTFALVAMKYVDAFDVSFQASPADPLLVIFGEVGSNYGLVFVTFNPPAKAPEESFEAPAESAETPKSADELKSAEAPKTTEAPKPPLGLQTLRSYALTNQIVSRVSFSADGREMAVAAMAAGHLFIFHIGADYKPELIRYTELGRGLADCFLMPVGGTVRSFSLVLFSDKYAIGERIVCINAETGKDNKFAGKMAGPYAQLLPLATPDTMLAVPHLSKQFHILKLSSDKGVTVQVKMGPIIDSGHDIRFFNGFFSPNALLTYGYDGTIILRTPDAPVEYDLKLPVTHRYQYGLKQAVVDDGVQFAVTLAAHRDVVALRLAGGQAGLDTQIALLAPVMAWFDVGKNKLKIIDRGQKNYLDLQEEKRVYEEMIDYKNQRDEVVKSFDVIQRQLVALLEENINEVPLHQLSLSEFNLHMENKKERLKQAEKEREEIRLKTEARIRAQDKVTAWIKKTCWDTMLTPRVKLFAIFSHYQVENYAVLPCQRDNWPSLQQVEALRAVEMENDGDLFRPWLEHVEMAEHVSEAAISVPTAQSIISVRSQHKSMESQIERVLSEDTVEGETSILSGTNAYQFVTVPPAMVSQTLAFSFLHMNWLSELVKS